LKAGATFPISHRSIVVLREHLAPEEEPDHSVAASVAAATQGRRR
jgi:glycogen operon protein